MMRKVLIIAPVIIFSIFVLWVIMQADSGENNMFVNFAHSMPHGDKLGHIFIFGMLTLFANMALRMRKVSLFSISIPLGAILVLIFAIAEEFTQLYFSTRTFDLMDIVCDLLGIVLVSYLQLMSHNRKARSS